MKRRGYRGKRRGLTCEQVIVFAAIAMAAMLFLTMTVNAKWTGQSVGEQVYDAVFVAKDWE